MYILHKNKNKNKKKQEQDPITGHMPPSNNAPDWSANGAPRKNSIPRSSKEFVQARIDSIISSRLNQTGDQISSEAHQHNHAQPEQEQRIDLSNAKSKQDKEDTLQQPTSNSCSSYSQNASSNNMSAEVADMIKRLKLNHQQHREQDQRIVFVGTKQYPDSGTHIFGEKNDRRMSGQSGIVCEGFIRKQGSCLCNEESYHTAIEINDDLDAEATVSMHNQDMLAAVVDTINTESPLEDVILEHIENAVESTDINELITTKVKKKKKHYEKGGKTCITVEVEEETNDTHTHGFQRNAFVIVALLLLIVIILIGLLFALARPRRTQ